MTIKRKKPNSKSSNKTAKYSPHRNFDDMEDVEDNDAGLIASAYKELAKHQRDKKKVKDKYADRDVPSDKKRTKVKEKISIEYSQALDEVSDINFDECNTNLDLLIALRTVLVNTLRTSRGAFNAKPTQGNAMTTARLVNDIQEISKQIEDAVDYEELADGALREIIKPFLERMLLELGQVIQETTDYFGNSEKKHKALKRYFNHMYRNYGSHLETKLPGLEEKLKKYILSNV